MGLSLKSFFNGLLTNVLSPLRRSLADLVFGRKGSGALPAESLAGLRVIPCGGKKEKHKKKAATVYLQLLSFYAFT
jgi:hypothetical protein